MADVFISYARAVRTPTLELAGKLWGVGYTTWTDTNLNADERPFKQVIDAEVDAAKAVITIWSPPALRSRWVPYESKRALKQGKLICTHTPDILDPEEALAGDFHGLNSAPVAEFMTIYNTLIKKGCRPAGKTAADLPEETVLEQLALAEWQAGINATDDPDVLRDFLRRFERARMVRDVAQLRLDQVEASRAARAGPAPAPEAEKAVRLFESIADGSDAEEFAFFLRKYAKSQPALAVIAAERLCELDPDRLLDVAKVRPDVEEAFAGQVAKARYAILIRDTPPDAAILRIDPGMHTAVINRIAVTADGHTLATASDDKTVRLWRVFDGKLLRTLRPPIGEGHEGKVYSVALDPAGEWAAAGGCDQINSNWVRVFDLSSGAVIVCLGPLPNVVNDLEVSADGQRLAAGLGSEGVRVWTLADGAWAESMADNDYGGGVYHLAFARDGQLATTSGDGYVRLYASDLSLKEKFKAPSGSEPYGIAFSLDGARLAIGYADLLCIDVLNPAKPRLLEAPDLAGLSGGTLGGVAWLADGRLVAGGNHGTLGSPILVWADGGRGPRTAWPGPNDTVMDLVPLPSGGVAVGGGEPAFGTLSAGGERLLWLGPATADMRGNVRDHFLVSADGHKVRFDLRYNSRDPILFDVQARTLAASDAAPPTLLPADTNRLPIERWEDGNMPTLKLSGPRDGRPIVLRLEKHEMARSLAIAPDAGTFVLGSEWHLRRFSGNGQLLWKRPVPDVAWGVNLAREGRLVLAACADGTIRWHRADDGEELLALFIHVPDDPAVEKRWVLFTPKGYYDCSPGADDLIGWHINRGPDKAAEFHPAHVFASTFHKPDIVSAALDDV